MTALLPQAPPEAISGIARLVEAHCGLRFAGGRRAELASKTARAFADSGCSTWDAYLDALSRRTAGPLLDQLITALTVGETYFFRHRAYFDLLEHDLLPRLIATRRRSGVRVLRFWSAGCATGEEAYSLAILLRRILPDLEAWDISILGTDLNSGFLLRARGGRYTDWSMRGTDDAFKSAYFTLEGQHYRIKPWVADLVRFARLNLAEPVYPSPANGTTGLDLILCRNVLIYLGPDTAKTVVARLRAALVPGGWLVVGPSDPVPGLLAGFDPYGDGNAIAYRRAEAEERLSPAPNTPMQHHQDPRKTTPQPLVSVPARKRRGASSPLPRVSATTATTNTDWPALWRAVRAATARNDLATAEATCRETIDRCAPGAEPYYLLGILRQSSGDHDGALVEFRRALYVDRAFVPALLATATIYRQAGLQQRSRRALERAQQILLDRPDEEPILAEEPVTVGRLRQILAQALSTGSEGTR